jgi:hypothetical protein
MNHSTASPSVSPQKLLAASVVPSVRCLSPCLTSGLAISRTGIAKENNY